jgi:hypothetical protein
MPAPPHHYAADFQAAFAAFGDYAIARQLSFTPTAPPMPLISPPFRDRHAAAFRRHGCRRHAAASPFSPARCRLFASIVAAVSLLPLMFSLMYYASFRHLIFFAFAMPLPPFRFQPAMPPFQLSP